MIDILSAADLIQTDMLFLATDEFSLFADAVITAAFLLHFFEVNKKEYRQPFFILLLGLAHCLVSIFANQYSANSYWLYYLIMVLTPFLYCAALCRGSLALKAVMSLYCFSLLTFPEHVVVRLIPYFAENGQMPYALFFLFFVLRRLGTKLFVLPVMFFILRRITRKWARIPFFCWAFMAAICLFGNVIPRVSAVGTEDPDVLVASILMMVLLVCVLLLINSLMEKEDALQTSIALIQQEQFQQQYSQQVNEISEALRKFRHDYKEHLFCMDSLLAEGEYDKLHAYLLEMHQMGIADMHLTQYCNDSGLNIILNQKQSMAKKCGIRFEASVLLPETGRIRQKDLNSVVFNLLNNAIEAAFSCPDGFVKIDIHETKAYLQITVQNSTDGNVLKKNAGMVSMKKDKELHGMGIKIIKDIVEKNHGIYEVFAEDGIFRTKIMLLDK